MHKTNHNNLLFRSLLRRWRAARHHKVRLRSLDARLRGQPDETGHVEMALCCMRPGEQGHVLSLCPDSEVRQHLLEMGFTAGTSVEVIRVAPLGDPITVRLRGYHLSLRRREAEAIRMRRCPPEFEAPARGE